MTTQTPFSWAATALGLCLALTACDPESSPASLDGGASSDEQASSGDAPEPVPCGEGDDPSSCDDCRALPDDACSEADPAAPACDRGTGLCMECGISAPGQCGDGLTCIDGACVDRCEDLGGTWAGLLTTTTSEPDHESIESQRELHLELEQVEGEGSAAYCPFGPWTQSMGAEPDAWIGLQGRIDTEEVRGRRGTRCRRHVVGLPRARRGPRRHVLRGHARRGLFAVRRRDQRFVPRWRLHRGAKLRSGRAAVADCRGWRSSTAAPPSET